MKESYRSDLKAHVLTDDSNRVRSIRHTGEYWKSPTRGGLMTAGAYIRHFADVYKIASEKLVPLQTKVSFLNPREQGEEYKLSHERRQFDSETFGFYQTYLNVPVWLAGLRVTVKQGPHRVVRSEDTSQLGVDAKMPSGDALERYRKLFVAANTVTVQRRAVEAQADLKAAMATLRPKARKSAAERNGEAFLRGLLSFESDSEANRASLRLIRGRFWIYRYDASARPESSARETPGSSRPRAFTVRPIDSSISDGAYYMVAEVTFEVFAGEDRLVWQALIELDTDSVLFLRPLAAGVNGLVFETDPITKTGNTEPNNVANNATLDPLRDDVVLQNLDAAPAGETQYLIGLFAEVTEVEGPIIAPTKEVSGTDFGYSVRTNDFAAVSGYFHVDRIFRTMQELGFNIDTYMSNTVFPIPVDIRYVDDIDAHCVGNGTEGISHVGYGLMDRDDLVNPLGRACDPRVHMHEVWGHGILYETVESANMIFCHSAGDSLSLIYFDPDSKCKGVDGTPLGKPGDLRFTYVPWHPWLDRRCDRNVADGWAWNGRYDDRDLGSEEILATTLFNVYRSIGGDDPNLETRVFASRMVMYLVLRAIGDLTPPTNPQYALDFANALMTADAGHWTSEGVCGGAYHKVIRWAFERQGEYQTPLVVRGSALDGTVASAGDPEDVDVYIDDGRAGEYQFQEVYWATTAIWNRYAADNVDIHQDPKLGSTNYAYVKIKNRGTQQAQNVVVAGYHALPDGELIWPTGYAAFTTPPINIGTVGPDNTQEVIVGPFEWTPFDDGNGQDRMLMVVSADGDAANVNNFTAAGEWIHEGRLVPNDNNIGLRSVILVP